MVDADGPVSRPRDRASRTSARMDRRDAARGHRGRGLLATRLGRDTRLDGDRRGVLLLRRPTTPPAAARAGVRAVFGHPGVVRWSAGELLAFSGWAGAL